MGGSRFKVELKEGIRSQQAAPKRVRVSLSPLILVLSLLANAIAVALFSRAEASQKASLESAFHP
jgi:hypothetical protein